MDRRSLLVGAAAAGAALVGTGRRAAASSSVILYETLGNGTVVAGSLQALVDATLAGDHIRIGLDAGDEYQETQAYQSMAVQSGAGYPPIVAGLSDLFDVSPNGDRFAGSNPYTLQVINTSDRDTWTIRRASEFGGPVPHPAYDKHSRGRYGFYRWSGTGRSRAVIARSDDMASMLAVQQQILNPVADIRLRFRVGAITYVTRPTLTYVPEQATEQWLMAWKVDPPDWTTRAFGIPIPTFTAPEDADFRTSTGIATARVIVHCRGYVSLMWLPLYVGTSSAYTPQSRDWIPTLVEVLGPLA